MYYDLDWDIFIKFNENDSYEYPKVTIPFTLDNPYIKKDFNLDILLWNFSGENQEIAKKVTSYVLFNFNKLFETAWTSLYHFLCAVEDYPETSLHTLKEFFKEQIDFDSQYYNIQLEVNCEHLFDGNARYCFVVSTTCDCSRWIISDDNMRVYMTGNKSSGTDTNNDSMQILQDYKDVCRYYYNENMFKDIYEKLDSGNFQYAPPFLK